MPDTTISGGPPTGLPEATEVLDPVNDRTPVDNVSAGATQAWAPGVYVREAGALMLSGADPMTGDLDLDGNDLITGAGLVDGRDVSADGAKVDTIETSADVTDASNVAAAGALMVDGSEVMTGDLDLDGNNLVGGGELIGTSLRATTGGLAFDSGGNPPIPDKSIAVDAQPITGGGDPSGAEGYALVVRAGAGGEADGAKNAGDGGNLVAEGAAGGASDSGDGGDGGDAIMRAGAGGASTSGTDGADGVVRIGETQTSAIASGDGSTTWTHDGPLAVTGIVTSAPKAVRTVSGSFTVAAADHDTIIRSTAAVAHNATFNSGVAGQYGSIIISSNGVLTLVSGTATVHVEQGSTLVAEALTVASRNLSLSYVYLSSTLVHVVGALVPA